MEHERTKQINDADHRDHHGLEGPERDRLRTLLVGAQLGWTTVSITWMTPFD